MVVDFLDDFDDSFFDSNSSPMTLVNRMGSGDSSGSNGGDGSISVKMKTGRENGRSKKSIKKHDSGASKNHSMGIERENNLSASKTNGRDDSEDDLSTNEDEESLSDSDNDSTASSSSSSSTSSSSTTSSSSSSAGDSTVKDKRLISNNHRTKDCSKSNLKSNRAIKKSIDVIAIDHGNSNGNGVKASNEYTGDINDDDDDDALLELFSTNGSTSDTADVTHTSKNANTTTVVHPAENATDNITTVIKMAREKISSNNSNAAKSNSNNNDNDGDLDNDLDLDDDALMEFFSNSQHSSRDPNTGKGDDGDGAGFHCGGDNGDGNDNIDNIINNAIIGNSNEESCSIEQIINKSSSKSLSNPTTGSANNNIELMDDSQANDTLIGSSNVEGEKVVVLEVDCDDDDDDDGLGDEESTTVVSANGATGEAHLSNASDHYHDADDASSTIDSILNVGSLQTKKSSKKIRNNNDSDDDEILELFSSNGNGGPSSSFFKKATSTNNSLPSCPEYDSSSLMSPHLIDLTKVGNDDNVLVRSSATNPINPYQKDPPNQMTKTSSVENNNSPSIYKALDRNFFTGNKISTNPTSATALLPEQQDKKDSPLSNHQNELQWLGIHHSHFKPPAYKRTPDPIVHHLDSKNRPPSTRRNIPVNTVFSHPIANFWKSKFTSFNHMQSEMVQVLANSDDNIIVSAPTGSGKTVLFEMAMGRLFASNLTGRHLQHELQGGIGGVSNTRKVVYIAPSKALCEERQADWSKRIADIDPGIVCTTITGDATAASSSYGDIASAHLILTTPEKWDSITRKWNDYVVLLGSIKLLVVDEVHMIGENERGSCLESIIGRMKTIQRAACARKFTASEIGSSSYKVATSEALASNMRIVAVSATLPNVAQIASFIESGEAYAFDISYRPVPLKTHVVACGFVGTNRYLFDKGLDRHVPQLLRRFSSGRPAIVFCHSKKDTEQLSEELSKSYSNQASLDNSALIKFSNQASSAILQRYLRAGIGYHHAGLDAGDRRLVEEAFMSGNISCLCATSTLAMGVNLPSHLVLIKGTSAYRGSANGHQDIDTGTLLQMIGRAGRPGFDTSGIAVIMTDSQSQRRFENLSHGLKVVESHLMDNCKLTEVINNEISQGVIKSAEEASDWVKGTFLFRRIQSNPLMYGMNGNGDEAIHSFVLEKCTQSIQQLRKVNAISMEEDGTVTPAAGCHIMSRHFIDFETMKSIVELPHDSGPLQLLKMLSRCSKMQSPVRRNEKKPLNEAHKMIKYKLDGPPSKVRIQAPYEKVFVLLQAAIGQHYFQDFSLRQEMSAAIDGASRILSAVEEYAKEGSGNGQVAVQGLLLRRSLAASLWGENDGVLNQIAGVGQDTTAKLRSNNISTFMDVLNSSSDGIEKACNMSPPFGNNLKAASSKILQHTLKLSACIQERDIGGTELLIKLERRDQDTSHLDEYGGKRIVTYSLLVYTDRPGGLLTFSADVSTESELRIPCPEKFGRAYIRLISSLIGLDEQVTVDGNDRIEKSSFSLSPAAAKSSSAPPKKRKVLEKHRNAVSSVNDLRIHNKRRKIATDEGDDDRRKSRASEHDSSVSETVAGKSAQKSVVTPSPHPPSRFQRNSNLTPMRYDHLRPSGRNGETVRNDNNSARTGNATTPKESNQRSRANNSYSHSKQQSGNRKGSRSWHQEKRQQKSLQQTSFNSPKENPFSQYSFDPNNIEASLNTASHDTKRCKEQSIFPSNVENSGYSAKKNRYQTQSAFRTPANRRKASVTSNRMSSAGLLQQKAMELQQQHYSQSATPRNITHRGTTHHMADAYGSNFIRSEIMPVNSYGRMATNPYSQNLGAPSAQMVPQALGMAPRAALTPPFVARRNNHDMMMSQESFPNGPMSSVGRPMSSAGYSMSSGFNNNYGHTNYKASMPQQQPPFHSMMHASQHHTQDIGAFYGEEPYFDEMNNFGSSANPQFGGFTDPFSGWQVADGNKENSGMNEFSNPPFYGGENNNSYDQYGSGASFGNRMDMHGIQNRYERGFPIRDNFNEQPAHHQGCHPPNQNLLYDDPPCHEVLVPTPPQGPNNETSFDDAFF